MEGAEEDCDLLSRPGGACAVALHAAECEPALLAALPCLPPPAGEPLRRERRAGRLVLSEQLELRRALLPVGLALREGKALLKEPAVEGLHVAHGRHRHEHVPAMGAYLVLHIALLVV
jgi:hypothetical protein